MKRIILLSLVFCSTLLWSQGKRVLFIGDSITDGWWGYNNGAPSRNRNHTDMNHIYGHSYMMLCAAHFQGRYPQKDYAFFNRGISGNTLSNLVERWQEDVLDLHPDVLSVLIGTNDAGQILRQRSANPNVTFDYSGWEQCYRNLLEQVRNQNPKVKLVLCAPFVAKEGSVGNAPDFAERSEIVNRLSSIVSRIAKDMNATFLPYDKMFSRLITRQPRPCYWIWDGVHPTTAGHQKMAEMWIHKVRL